MSTRYHRLARRHAFLASLAAVFGVIALAVSLIGLTNDRPDVFFAGVAATVTLGFVVVTQALEAIRCSEISERFLEDQQNGNGRNLP